MLGVELDDEVRGELFFTVMLALLVLLIALLSAWVLSQKEVSTLLRIYANGSCCAGHSPSLSDAELAGVRKALHNYSLLFSIPIFPLFMCMGRRRAQAGIAVLSLLTGVAVVAVSPGGDHKACEDCLWPVLLSVCVSSACGLYALSVIAGRVANCLDRHLSKS